MSSVQETTIRKHSRARRVTKSWKEELSHSDGELDLEYSVSEEDVDCSASDEDYRPGDTESQEEGDEGDDDDLYSVRLDFCVTVCKESIFSHCICVSLQWCILHCVFLCFSIRIVQFSFSFSPVSLPSLFYSKQQRH